MRAALFLAIICLTAAQRRPNSTPGFLLSAMASMKNKLSDKDILVQPAEMTLGTCGIRCTANADCQGIAYNHKNHMCQLHSKTPGSGKKADNWGAYEKKKGKKFGS